MIEKEGLMGLIIKYLKKKKNCIKIRDTIC